MIDVTMLSTRSDPATWRSVDVKVPALPRVGDFVNHEPSGVSGYVHRVLFSWDEEGKLVIEVRVT
jgi:hypothetical protein